MAVHGRARAIWGDGDGRGNSWFKSYIVVVHLQQIIWMVLHERSLASYIIPGKKQVNDCVLWFHFSVSKQHLSLLIHVFPKLLRYRKGSHHNGRVAEHHTQQEQLGLNFENI